MNELERDLRDVFDRQQRSLGSLTGVRERVLRDALAPAPPRGRRPLRLAGGLIAVLLAAAIVGTLVLARQNAQVHQAVPAGTPTAAPTPVASPTPPQVADSVPLMVIGTPADRTRMQGLTWDGRPAAVTAPINGKDFSINPTGTLYASGADLRDRSGRVVGSTDPSRSRLAWADDGRHYCLLTHSSQLPPPAGEPITLLVAAPGEPARTVGQVGAVSETTFVSAAACSVERDRAIVVQSGAQGITTARAWAVQLSTGRILWSKSFPSDGTSTIRVTASHDGQYVAEVTAPCCQPGPPAPHTTIYDAAGTPVAHLTGIVEAFSWDATLAVVSFDGSTPAERHVSVVRWRDGTVVWTGPTGMPYLHAVPEPVAGGRLAVGVFDQSATNTSGFSSGDVYGVTPDGRAVLLARGVAF